MKTTIFWVKTPDMSPPTELGLNRIHTVPTQNNSWPQIEMTFEQQIGPGTTHGKFQPL
jgi:hypothetical protein